jgi:membrane protein
MALSGMLLDLDGTLVASNQAHIAAWEQALRAHGYHVAPDRIAEEVGKGGDHLVPDLLGHQAEAEHGDAIRETHGQIFVDRIRREGLHVAPDAVDLLRALREHGVQTALATSSQREHLDVVEEVSGVQWHKLVDVVVTAADVGSSKPSPDLMHAALHKLGLTAAQCAMLGDTPWDAIAARRAGVVPIGVTYGGNDKKSLYRSGARLVYGDTAELIRHLDDALNAASPVCMPLDRAALEHLMRIALAEAERALSYGEVPIGSLIADGKGNVLGVGHNRYNQTGNKARHAELDAFEAAAGKIAAHARDTILVSTVEPCVMCTGAAMETAVDLVLYGLPAPEDGGTRRVAPPESEESQVPRAVGPVLPDESRALFQRWLKKDDRNRDQEPYVKQLLTAVT